MILPCYLHSIDIYALFTGYEDDIFEVISNFARSELQIWRKIFNKIELRWVHGVCFFLVRVAFLLALKIV